MIGGIICDSRFDGMRRKAVIVEEVGKRRLTEPWTAPCAMSWRFETAFAADLTGSLGLTYGPNDIDLHWFPNNASLKTTPGYSMRRGRQTAVVQRSAPCFAGGISAHTDR